MQSGTDGGSISNDVRAPCIYKFLIPQRLVGKLIGRCGHRINNIEKTAHVFVYLQDYLGCLDVKVCTVEGSSKDIEIALKMIRNTFPINDHPLFDVVLVPQIIARPFLENRRLYLMDGVTNDVVISNLLSASHLFVQQPNHFTYHYLSILNHYMTEFYSHPLRPICKTLAVNLLCVAPFQDGWFRAQITHLNSEHSLCQVKFLDYGSFITVPVSMLRQIAPEFLHLPFQAIECYLAGIRPIDEGNIWSEQARELVDDLAQTNCLRAVVCGYAENGIPFIYLYSVVDEQIIVINDELVSQGFAIRL